MLEPRVVPTSPVYDPSLGVGDARIMNLARRAHVIDGADHIFSQGAARSELLQLLTNELPR